MSLSGSLSASLEDYLEAIYNIIAEKGGVRAKDIAEYLDVKAGSVTTALQSLAKSELVNYQPYEVITLTGKGLQEAKRVIRKHEILQDFFLDVLGADPQVAQEGACSIEHVIPDDLVERLISFTEFIQACPRCGDKWIARFRSNCSSRVPQNAADCKECLNEGIQGLEKEKEKIANPPAMKTLVEMANGQKGVVMRINKKASITKRLVEMGISRGSVIEVERVAPLGDPIEIKVKGYHLSIRKDEAENIEIESN